ncbi:hypothetical protein ACPH7A_001449 [Enterobacter roggenkampii]|uniref:hypothetical protein n=1 Tax=Enterobacteriaceae TaxID=543 RepID=UPI0007B3BD72|nr:hypothetical protein [Enterobacter roggenkampii]QJL42381.1 hypothetical protein HJW93_02335 [Klebsiella pneumoniae]CAE6216016.1 hypothetical protein AI2705V1_0420 [Enterobacter cloacae]HAS1290967.1 hypothetical protein [Enterobacter hormaechei]HDS7902961.1 hypothetical protein [Enterobacter hormaechei subsp. steigerwaltii]KZQ14829.1 hypothetical protein A3461_19925 [Enterobacter roggenkampii]
MDFDAMAYPEKFTIAGTEYKGRRNSTEKKVLIPYTEEPDISIGDEITQKLGKGEISLKVLDMSFLPGGTLNVGTNHPHMLTLKVENLTANEHKPKPPSQNTFNIGSVSGTQVQIGERNHLIVNISITELVEKVSQSQDPQAKSLLKDLLNNSTVASLVGAGASALLALL